MKNKPFSKIPTLCGERITLEKIGKKSTDDLKELVGSDEVYK